MTRHGWMAELRPEKVEYYKQLHASPWAEVLQRIKASHLQNYSIYLREIDGRFFLFSYFEYVGENYEEDMRRIEQDPATQRWWQETGPCQIPLEHAARHSPVWAELTEVFHTD